MPETLRDLVVSLSLQSDNFTRNMQSADATFRLLTVDIKDGRAGFRDDGL